MIFKLFSIVTRKIDIYLTSTVVGQKATNRSAQHMLERFLHTVYISRSEDGRWEHSKGLRVIFEEYSGEPE